MISRVKRKYLIISVVAALGLWWLCCLPRDLFSGTSYSTVVLDKSGQLIGARVSDDEQWRFPPCDSVPVKFEKALLEFEDRTFYKHCGVSIRALARAIIQNIRNTRVVSGASTISMQVIRLSRNKPRTVGEKLLEMFMATRLELRYSKEEILRLYASYAPFGGNVVGIDAALWRYLGSDGADLSWAEAATLAVMQNAPARMHLDKNRAALQAKRDRLLKRLYEKGELDEWDYELALEEPLMDRPMQMPQYAAHLVSRYDKLYRGRKCLTNIDLEFQQRFEELLRRWSEDLRRNAANDLSAVVVDVQSGELIAYCGNADMEFEREGKWVDIARSARSSGSVLKPILYAAALQNGTILPNSILPDAPTDFGGFAPKNFDGSYNGAMQADKAIALSLNIPSVHLLQEYGVSSFAQLMQKAGFSTIDKADSEYGLSLILGGAEITLMDVVNCYAQMAAVYQDSTRCASFPLRDRVALYKSFETMRSVVRADNLDYEIASSAQNIAWKTGTSYGARDAWAVGLTPKYVVGVWVGNADGSTVPNMTGSRTAGPVLFDLMALLPHCDWFEEPGQEDGVRLRVCSHSGYRAGRFCDEVNWQVLPKSAVNSDICPYCRELPAGTEPCSTGRNRFVLPALLEFYYKPLHPEYEGMPTELATDFHFIYPADGIIVSLPKQMDGSKGELICKIAHSRPSEELFWHLDSGYLGATRDIHNMNIALEKGLHTITAIDAKGREQSVTVLVN